MTNMADMPLYGKHLKILLLWNQKADDLESWYAASGTQVLPSLFNGGPRLTLTYFTAWSDLVHYAFVLEKRKTMDFSETIVVYDIKVCRCSQLNEYMKPYEYQRLRSFIDLGPNLWFNVLYFFSSITTGSIEAKFHMELLWDWKTRTYSNMTAMSIYGKNL